MRLIDADALKAKWYKINDIDENDRGARFVGYTEIARLIDQAPTVSADAVHGEWIMHIDDLFPEESTQECSNCHEHETIKIRSDNFCPNCGARMKGGAEE